MGIICATVNQEKMRDAAVIVAWIAQNFRNRPITVIIITREAGGSRPVRFHGPLLIVPHSISVGFLKPLQVRLSGSFLGFIYRENHGAQKRRLRARQVVCTVRIEDAAIMLNLKEKIFNHSLCQVEAMVPQQTSNNEITIPAIHFIELAAWDDVRIFKIEQAVRL